MNKLNEELLNLSDTFKQADEVVKYVRDFCKNNEIKILKIENNSYKDRAYFTVHTQISPELKYWGAPFTINLKLVDHVPTKTLTEVLSEFQKRSVK